ncbi:unnamed protein product, partial [Staurois parvus]
MIPYCPGPHELSVHPWTPPLLFGQGHRGPMSCQSAPD